VDESVTGLIIGAKGATIKKLKTDYPGVEFKISGKNQGGKIELTGEKGQANKAKAAILKIVSGSKNKNKNKNDKNMQHLTCEHPPIPAGTTRFWLGKIQEEEEEEGSNHQKSACHPSYSALAADPATTPGHPTMATTSRHQPTEHGKAWVKYLDFYFTAGDDDSSHDEVYRQNPLLEKAVGTKETPKAEVMECTQGSGGKAEHGEATKLRQAKYAHLQKDILFRMGEELRRQKAEVSNKKREASERTVARDRPAEGAWVQYECYCYTAIGTESWSHDEVYRQNSLLEEAAGTMDDPRAAIMDVTQGSGAKVSGEATNQRQGQYERNTALMAVQMSQVVDALGPTIETLDPTTQTVKKLLVQCHERNATVTPPSFKAGGAKPIHLDDIYVVLYQVDHAELLEAGHSPGSDNPAAVRVTGTRICSPERRSGSPTPRSNSAMGHVRSASSWKASPAPARPRW